MANCCCCSKSLVALAALFLLVVAFLPDTQSYFGFDIKIGSNHEEWQQRFSKLSLPETFSGPLLANRLLSQADHLFENEIQSPESFVMWEDKVYTGLNDGRIVQILEDRYETVAFLDDENVGLKVCSKFHNAHKCRRPLGLKFDSRGILYTMDPYHGIYSVNITTGDYQVVVDSSKEAGLGSRFIDDLVLVEKDNGHLVFYITEASTVWDAHDTAYLLLEREASGRLLSYDTETKLVTVELDNLAFPNGVELTDDKSAILMNSFTERSVYKYTIKGANKGKLEVLIENLPGEPDNIKRSLDPNRETYWVALFIARNAHNPNFFLDTFAKNRYAVRFVLRLQKLVGVTLTKLGNLFGSELLLALGFDINIGYSLGKMSCNYGMAIEIDSTGTIVNSIHSPDGVTPLISEVFEYKQTSTERYFYLGSAINSYLGRLIVPKTALSGSSKPNSSKSQTTQKVKPTKPRIEPKKTTSPPKAKTEPNQKSKDEL